MRRIAAVLIAAALLFVPGYAAAQFAYGPGGGIVVTTNEVNASGQVATAQSLIPTTMTTTQTGLCAGVQCVLDVQGIFGTAAAPGTITVIVSYGGIGMTLVNAVTPTASLVNVPFRLQMWIIPDSTLGAAPTGKAILARFEWVNSNTIGTAPTVYYGTNTGAIVNTATQTMVATVTFSDTSIASGMIARRAWFGAAAN